MTANNPPKTHPLEHLWRHFVAMGAPWPLPVECKIMHAAWVGSSSAQKGRPGARRWGAIFEICSAGVARRRFSHDLDVLLTPPGGEFASS